MGRSSTAFGLNDFIAANPDVAPTSFQWSGQFCRGLHHRDRSDRQNLSFDEVVTDLPQALEGFGFGASYTYAENSLEDETGNEITIPGYSDTVWSGDIYYENFGWRGKLSARHRSGFLSEILQFDGTLSGASALEETILDAQVGYEWDDGPLEGFSVNLEVFNLTNEPFVTDNETALSGVRFPSRHEEYGRTYNFTISKRF